MSDYARMVRAILTEDVQNLQQALGNSDGLNALDDTGRTPLHIAVMHSRTSVIEPLINAGADPTIKSGDHRTATEVAQEKGELVADTLKFAEQKRDTKQTAAASTTTVVSKPATKPSIPISTRAAEAMRARRRSAGLLGDTA